MVAPIFHALARGICIYILAAQSILLDLLIIWSGEGRGGKGELGVCVWGGC